MTAARRCHRTEVNRDDRGMADIVRKDGEMAVDVLLVIPLPKVHVHVLRWNYETGIRMLAR